MELLASPGKKHFLSPYSLLLKYSLVVLYLHICLYFKLLKDWDSVWLTSSMQNMAWITESAHERIVIANTDCLYNKHTSVCACVCVCMRVCVSGVGWWWQHVEHHLCWSLSPPPSISRWVSPFPCSSFSNHIRLITAASPVSQLQPFTILCRAGFPRCLFTLWHTFHLFTFRVFFSVI